MSYMENNTHKMIDALAASVGAITRRVDDNAAKLDKHTEAIEKQAEAQSANKASIDDILKRLNRLEKDPRGHYETVVNQTKAVLSKEYLDARRALRLWPIVGHNENTVWEAVGDFIHTTLSIPHTDINQECIESITRVQDPVAVGTVKDEVLVVFFDAKDRDLVMSDAAGLASHVDATGKPTAGIRLEIPPELVSTFRLLSRFGTRLRARHGDGTRRHIKFDNFAGSLYANIKLPGDLSWTRITPEMARRDLEASFQKERESAQERMAIKLLPGPRDRLNRPQSTSAAPGQRMIGPSALGQPPKKWGPPRRPVSSST